jgi:hypothetical protein
LLHDLDELPAKRPRTRRLTEILCRTTAGDSVSQRRKGEEEGGVTGGDFPDSTSQESALESRVEKIFTVLNQMEVDGVI